MKNITKLLLLVSLFLNFSYNALSESPEAYLDSILKETTSKGDINYFMKEIDWNNSYKNMPPSAKDALGVSSVDDYKKFMEMGFKEPKKAVEATVNRMIAKADPSQKQMMEMMKPMMMQNADKMIDMKTHWVSNLDKMKYDIGASSQNGDTAKVPVTFSLEDKTEKRDIQLTKINGEWKISF